jgi:hypothetical protein
MMADGAAHRRAGNGMVAGHMAHDPAHRGALQAAVRLRAQGKRAQHERRDHERNPIANEKGGGSALETV